MAGWRIGQLAACRPPAWLAVRLGGTEADRGSHPPTTLPLHPQPFTLSIFTYNGVDTDGTATQGGYSTFYVVNKK